MFIAKINEQCKEKKWKVKGALRPGLRGGEYVYENSECGFRNSECRMTFVDRDS